jgi:hypothetical protein
MRLLISVFKNGKLQVIFYFLISSLYFVTSLKFSGAEAYLYTGILAYLKWSFLSVLLNIGFLIQFFKPTGWTQILAIPLMLIATFVNWLVYTNPKSFITYDILSVVLMLISLFLIAKGFLKNGENLYA